MLVRIPAQKWIILVRIPARRWISLVRIYPLTWIMLVRMPGSCSWEMTHKRFTWASTRSKHGSKADQPNKDCFHTLHARRWQGEGPESVETIQLD